jgi:outer membrane protein
MKWSFLLLCWVTNIVFALTLEEAEELALQNHPQIRAAEELIERAKQGRWEAISKWLPKLTLLSQAFKTQKPLKFLKLNKPSAFFTQISLTQSIVSSDLYHDIRIASLLVEQYDEMLKTARNDILFETRVLYNLIALDRRKVATAKEHTELLTLLQERMEGKFLIGEAIAYNVNQAKVAVANVANNYYDAVKNLKSHEDELSQALGIDPVANPYAFNQEEIAQVQIPKMGSEEWVGLADEHRPDILLSKTALRVAHQEVKKKQGEYWPALAVLGGYGGGSTPYLELPSDHWRQQIFQWALGVSLSWTVFDGTGRERRIQKAKAGFRASRFDLQKVAQAAHTDVRTQLYKIEDAQFKLETASKTLELAGETLQQAISQLDIGYITIFDYMISVDGLIRSKTAFDENQFELVSAYYGLLHACGKERL